MTLEYVYSFPRSFFTTGSRKKQYVVKCSVLEELIRQAKVLLEAAEESKVFIQCFDKIWLEKVNDREKIITVWESLEIMHFLKDFI